MTTGLPLWSCSAVLSENRNFATERPEQVDVWPQLDDTSLPLMCRRFPKREASLYGVICVVIVQVLH